MAVNTGRRGPASGPTSFDHLQYGDLVAFYVEDKVRIRIVVMMMMVMDLYYVPVYLNVWVVVYRHIK